jgi:hypothetical protein
MYVCSIILTVFTKEGNIMHRESTLSLKPIISVNALRREETDMRLQLDCADGDYAIDLVLAHRGSRQVFRFPELLLSTFLSEEVGKEIDEAGQNSTESDQREVKTALRKGATEITSGAVLEIGFYHEDSAERQAREWYIDDDIEDDEPHACRFRLTIPACNYSSDLWASCGEIQKVLVHVGDKRGFTEGFFRAEEPFGWSDW